MAKILRITLVASVLAISASIGSAQQPDAEFSLFENVEQTARQRQVQPPNSRVRQENGGGGRPEFTLVGTSHIRDNYSVILQHQSGETIRMPVRRQANTAIPGYNGYTVVDIGAGKVSLRLPQDTPCEAFADQGVACSGAGNIALLSLATAAALPPRQRLEPEANAEVLLNEEGIAVDANGDPIAPVEATGTEATPTNPFASLRSAIESAEAQGVERFQARRIPPEDVPPGMRVVSTPFGDRLVEDN